MPRGQRFDSETRLNTSVEALSAAHADVRAAVHEAHPDPSTIPNIVSDALRQMHWLIRDVRDNATLNEGDHDMAKLRPSKG